MAEADRMERRGQHDAAHPGIPCRAQHPKGAVARRADHLVLVVDLAWAHRGGDVQHGVDAGDRVGPALRRA